MGSGPVPLSYSADELLMILEQRLHESRPAAEWLAALTTQDPHLAASALPETDMESLTSVSTAESQQAPRPVTRALVADRASRRAAAQGAAVAKAADVAAALAELVAEDRRHEAPVESSPPAPGKQSPAPAREPVAAEQPEKPEISPVPSLEEPEAIPPVEATSTGRTRTFRVFVSSTFVDFEAERDMLRREVWPKLRELCAAHGARFQPIDLRWGVSEEAAVDQQTMNICLGEIERCHQLTPRPNFLVLIGNRYGWRPPPPQIPEAEYEQIIRRLDSDPALVSDWEHTGELQAADAVPPEQFLQRWYERDDNAVPPEYRLRRRTGRYLDPAQWGTVETRLARALAAGVKDLDLPETRRRRYLTSATEQEIVAGALEATEREIADGSSEMGDPARAVCVIREIVDHPDVAEADRNDPVRTYADEDQTDLEALKQRIRKHLGERRIVELTAPWGDDKPTLEQGYLHAFADGVRRLMARSIREELEHPTTTRDQAAAVTGDALAQEIEAHRRFAAERRECFTGRTDELEAIDAYLAGDGQRPLAVQGTGGTGKSALMAEALRRATERSDGMVLARFVGATPGSSDGRALLESMCQELARTVGDTETPVPSEYADLVSDLARRLREVAAQQPVWVFVDSLDQLTGNARSLTWVPQPLPEGVRMVLSTRPGDTLEPLTRRESSELELGGLPATDGAALLEKWLGSAHRTVQDPQRQAVLEAFERSEGNPLYLRLAFEEARRWSSVDPPEDLAVGVPGLIRGNLLARLASEDNHGEPLVAKVLGYLAASRYGLTEDELTDLLSRDPDLYRWFLLGAYHLPGDLIDRARDYAGRPPDQEPAKWLLSLREAAKLLEEEPWQILRLLSRAHGFTADELAGRSGLHPERVRGTLSRLRAEGLAQPDEVERWTASTTVAADDNPKLAWAIAYRAAAADHNRWSFPGLDPAGEPTVDNRDAARQWLDKLDGWRSELDTFLTAVVPARLPSAEDGDRLVTRPGPGPDLPVVFWSRLSFDLAPYLTERRTEGGDLLSFYHRELQDVSAEVYAAGDNGCLLHSRLADYFQAAADPNGDQTWTTDDHRAGIRGLGELPYHLTHAERWDDVYETLTDFTFLEQKAATVGVTTRSEGERDTKLYTGVFQLQDDYDTALRLMPGGEGGKTDRPRLIVTAVDFGEGLVVRCPHCNTVHALDRECASCQTTHRLADWRAKEVDCPTSTCKGPLRVNDFVVQRRSTT